MRSGCRFARSRFRLCQSGDVDLGNLHRIVRPIIAWVGRLARDLLHEFDTLGRALSEDRVMSVEMRRWHFRDEELRAVGVRSRVGHRESAGDIEIQIRRDFIFKAVAGTAFARSFRIAALDHEIWKYGMEGCAGVKPYSMFFFSRFRIRPIFGASGEAD